MHETYCSEHIVSSMEAPPKRSEQTKEKKEEVNLSKMKKMKQKRDWTRVHLSNCKYAMENSKNEKCFLSVNSTYLISHLQFYFTVSLCVFFLFIFSFAVSDFRCLFFFSSIFFLFIWTIFCLMAATREERLKWRWSHKKWREWERITSKRRFGIHHQVHSVYDSSMLSGLKWQGEKKGCDKENHT